MNNELEKQAREIADGWQMMNAKGLSLGDCFNGCAKEALQLKQAEIEKLVKELSTMNDYAKNMDEKLFRAEARAEELESAISTHKIRCYSMQEAIGGPHCPQDVELWEVIN